MRKAPPLLVAAFTGAIGLVGLGAIAVVLLVALRLLHDVLEFVLP